MLKSMLDAVMERRARRLTDHVRAWLPTEGRVLDLGSGTGHFSACWSGSADSTWSPLM
jgi:tRNA/tmRNA/rRNA uracil-C5-methylase (TrmA/RlmC/RlmD family)